MACALLATWTAGAQPAGPVETAVKYLEASKAGRCSEVWSLYSAATQEDQRAAARRERERDGARDEADPEKACPPMHASLKRGSARLVREQAGEAAVEVVFRGRASTSRNDIGTIRQWKQELRLVREGNSWKVDLPR